MRGLLIFVALFAGSAVAAEPGAWPQDKLLTRSMTTPLTAVNLGKPLWSLNAQCAGSFGASYQRTLALKGQSRAEADKRLGVDMLNTALALLQDNRGITRAEALKLVTNEVEVGRAKARTALGDGTGAYTPWNYLRSTCLDLAGALSPGR